MSREERTRASKLLDRENMVIGEKQSESTDENSRHLTANSEALMKLFGKDLHQKESIVVEDDKSSEISDTDGQLSEQREKTELTMQEGHSTLGPLQTIKDGRQQDANAYIEAGREYEYSKIQEDRKYQTIPQQADSYVVPEQVQMPSGQQQQVVQQYQTEKSVNLSMEQYRNRQDLKSINNLDLHMQQRQPIGQTWQIPSGQQQVVQQYQPEQLQPLYKEAKSERVDQYRTPVTHQQSFEESYVTQYRDQQDLQLINNLDLHMQQGQPLRHKQQEPTSPKQQQMGTGRYNYRSISKPEASYKSFKKQIIAVHSPKGGVGKTTISKELTFGLGSARINNELLKILVVDADWEFGDVATQFDVSPVPNVSEWVRDMLYEREHNGSIPIYSKEEISDRYIIHYNENIDILAGSSNANDAMLLDADIVSAILDNLRHCDYDFIIVDNANSLKNITIVPLQKADTIVLVETLDTTTVQETTTMLDTLRSIQFDFSKIRMVLNQVPTDDKKLDIGVAEIPRVLKMELTAVIPYYDKVRLYNNAGEAAISDRETPFSKEIKKIINTIMPIYNTKSKGFLARFFSRKK